MRLVVLTGPEIGEEEATVGLGPSDSGCWGDGSLMRVEEDVDGTEDWSSNAQQRMKTRRMVMVVETGDYGW